MDKKEQILHFCLTGRMKFRKSDHNCQIKKNKNKQQGSQVCGPQTCEP